MKQAISALINVDIFDKLQKAYKNQKYQTSYSVFLEVVLGEGLRNLEDGDG